MSHCISLSIIKPRAVTAWLLSALLLLIATISGAAAPPAGTQIGNQASATYTDSQGVAHTVTSNIVQTTVQQVAALTLVATASQNATPGSVVYYPETLTNTGNGTDTFNLTTGNAGAFTMANVQIFADNGSGQPTGPAITSSGALGSGASFKFVVVATLPNTATAGQSNTLTLTAASTFNAAVTANLTDTTTVTNNAVVTVSKSISAASGAAGSGPYTYTLTYTNTGNSTATNLTLGDVIPSGLNYVAGSARWSVTGATALSDAGGTSGTSPNTLTSSYTGGSATWTATIAQVTAGQSGTVSFQVNVAAATAAGTINNTATFSYNGGASQNTNTVGFTVKQTAGVTLTGQTVAGPGAPGASVSFSNAVQNTGNGTDTFNISIATATSNFPAGTTFQLFKSDGVTPLVDTNGDGIPDTGPVAAGASYNVIVKATLPPSATNTGAPFNLSKTATSVLNPATSSTTTDTLTAIAANAVDVTNNAAFNGGAPAPGQGAGPEVSAVVTNTVNPAASTTFTLYINNRGPSPDNYNLGASTSATFATTALPSGWTVTFKADGGAGNCSSTGATLSNTGAIASLANGVVCAVVAVPSGAPAANTDLYFRALSPNSGVADTVHDLVAVNAARSLMLTPNQSGQTYPGGSYVYTETLTNTGNVTEGNGGSSTIALASGNNQQGWTSQIYYNADGASTLDANDPLITGNLNAVAGLGAGLAPGQSITLFVKVIAPGGATVGASNTTTVTATTTNGGGAIGAAPAAVSITDNTTVIAGNLSLGKLQALDANCTGPGGGTVYASSNVSAKPGQCVLYQITVTNVGSTSATAVVVSDSTPTFTTLSTAATTTVGTIAAGGPALGATGTVTANIGTLNAGQSAVVTFGVQVNH